MYTVKYFHKNFTYIVYAVCLKSQLILLDKQWNFARRGSTHSCEDRLPFSRSSPPGHAAVLRCGMWFCIGGMMDSTVLDVKRCADFYPYYSMIIFRKVFFVSEGHRKPETYRANLYDQYKFCASQSVLLKTEWTVTFYQVSFCIFWLFVLKRFFDRSII